MMKQDIKSSRKTMAYSSWNYSWIFACISLIRLFRESHGVEGCGWFAKIPSRGSNEIHFLGNTLRTVLWCTCAPILLVLSVLFPLISRVLPWSIEESTISDKLAPMPHVVLSDAVKKKELSVPKAHYEVSALHPRWVLRITHPLSWEDITDPNRCQQIPWSEECREKGYTALSYFIDSTIPLWTSAGYNTPPKKRTIPQRRCLALRYLFEYSRAYVAKYGCPQGPQYVWIDELCISPLDISGFGSMHIGRSPSLWSQNQGDDMKEERQEELGRLTDIFRTAKCVCVFCERFGCDHTDVNCKWGQRAWTLSEIVHASTVLQMTASHFNSGRWSWDLRKIEGRLFKGHMKGHAERNQKWHLHAVLEHATNSGSTSWQHTIQALVIEVIRRSDVSGYGYGGRHTYSEIGRALNGLLPRRANPKCFSKNNGWADLTMLLELNQGFYNTAALAAVCPVAHHTEHLHRWLAKPIDPKPGQERIEPLVKAFPIIDPSPPVRSISDFRGRPQLDEASGRQGLNTALCLVDPHVIELKPVFKRDGSTIYSTPMNPLRICVLATLGLVFILGIVVIPTNRNAGVAVCWLTTCIYAFIRLALGTMCVKMDGWVCWEEQDGEMEHLDRVHFDSNLSQFRTWDTLHHLAPEFPLPETTPTRTVTIMDLKNMIQIPVKIPANAKKPSYIVPIALHGSGITCILVVDQEGNVRDSENPKEYVWTKVGMVHLPTFILEDARVVGTFYVGGRPPLGIQGSHSTC